MSLTPREYLLLEVIAQYLELYGRPPPSRSNRYLVEQTGLSSNSISNLKRRLKEKGCLDESLDLTTRGENYLLAQRQASMQASLSSRALTQSATSPIPIRGTVLAGATGLDFEGFMVEWESPGDPQAENRLLSGITLAAGRDAIALSVAGQGMQREGIYDGDWLVVEKWEAGLPKPGEMIVATYLPVAAADHFRESEWGDFIGPVVAYFEEAAGEPEDWAGRSQEWAGQSKSWACRLVWGRKGRNRLELTVRALRPIGKVIGVYREL